MTTPAKTPPHFFTLVLLTGLSVLSLNMFMPSLANMAEDFRVGYATINLAVAGYLGVTAVLRLIVGPLSDLYGRRPVLLICLGVFLIASLVCAYADNFYVFLAARIFQGGIAAGSVVPQAIIRDTSSSSGSASRLGYLAMAMAAAPMLGPVLGGGLDELFGWRASFLAYSLLGGLALLICWLDVGETNPERKDTLAAQIRGYPELFRSRRYWGYALCVSTSIAAFFCFISAAPLVARALFNTSTGTLGIYIGSITAGFMVGGFISGKFGPRFRLTTMMITGRTVACAGLIAGLGLYVSGVVHELALFGSTIFVGFGNGLTTPSANAGALSVRKHLAGSAAGLTGAMTVGGGALVTTFTGAVITPENGVYVMLGMMLACAAAGLLAALSVLWIDRREDPSGSVD